MSSTQELDLLEDIRKYLKARVALEVQYADGMQKLSTTFLGHKTANVPDIQTADNEQVRMNFESTLIYSHNFGRGGREEGRPSIKCEGPYTFYLRLLRSPASLARL